MASCPLDTMYAKAAFLNLAADRRFRLTAAAGYLLFDFGLTRAVKPAKYFLRPYQCESGFDEPWSERIQRILDSREAGLYMPWQDLRRALTAGRFAGNTCAGWTAATTANPVRSERKQRQQMLPGVRPATATETLLRSDVCCQNSNSIVNCPTIKRSLDGHRRQDWPATCPHPLPLP